MDSRLLKLYNEELQHIRDMGGEFAREYPKIARRLGLDDVECADPYVERLLEGFAFLAARIQLKLDAEFPRFTQHLLEMVYPHYLAPTPSMVVVEFQPDPGEGSLANGYRIERGTALRSVLGPGDKTACEYRTGHPVDLWPVRLVAAEYITHPGDLVGIDAPQINAQAAIKLELHATAGLNFHEIDLNDLALHLRGADSSAMKIYEELLGHASGIVALGSRNGSSWKQYLPEATVERLGFESEYSIIPYDPRSFQGYRVLQEYFAFPDRFMFANLRGLKPAIQHCEDSKIEILLLLDRNDPTLRTVVDESRFALFCSPAINLFPQRTDRIHLSNRATEYHVVPDRTRPLDLEVYAVERVTGHGTRADQRRDFEPFYASRDRGSQSRTGAYFTVRREPRLMSERQRREGARSSYPGSEVFLSIVDAQEAPYDPKLRELEVHTLCTNRDLPLMLSVFGEGPTDFTLSTGAPVLSVRCITGPTVPQGSPPEGEATWRLISHLSLNYLTLADSEGQGAAALRELLMLYANMSDPSLQRQVNGVRSITTRPVTRRSLTPGPISHVRGLEVTLTLDESAFAGSGVFLLGAVLEHFFSKYASINSFTETVVCSNQRGEVMRWPARAGNRQTV